MGRPRKPTQLHELSGAFEKDPQRKRARAQEPKSEDPIGPPPQHWDVPDGALRCQEFQRLRAIWEELVVQAPSGVLSSADRVHLEIICGLVDKYRRNLLRDAGLKTLNKMMGEIALNAGARSRFTVKLFSGAPAPSKKDANNPFIEIKKEGDHFRPN
jgi:hypothetical protein